MRRRDDDAPMSSNVAFLGRETSSVVLGQRASIIIRPSTNTWFCPKPRSQSCGAL